MRKRNSALIFSLIFSLLLLAAPQLIAAQEQPAAGQRQTQPSQNADQTLLKRPNLLQSLNLTADQIQQIRAINQELRETVRAANIRQRQARRALDAAIYADVPNQSEVDQRLGELATAQADAIKLRTAVEFRIRQILTADQLIRFRDLRRQFEQKMRQQLLPQQRALRQLKNKPL